MHISDKLIDSKTGKIVKPEDVRPSHKLIIEVIEDVPRYYAQRGCVCAELKVHEKK